jgi:hypothetical protein
MITPEVAQFQDERTQLSSDITIDELLEKLVAANIPVEDYGMGAAKTVAHLLFEIRDGESIVSVDAKGNLLRELSVVCVDVVHKNAEGDVFVLKEDKQVFRNGSERRRNIDTSLGEKMKPGEDPLTAVPRAIKEELGINEGVEAVYFLGFEENTHIPDVFPGLESSYALHKYAVIISEDSFKPEGYVEHQADKTNFFTWRRIYPTPYEESL